MEPRVKNGDKMRLWDVSCSLVIVRWLNNRWTFASIGWPATYWAVMMIVTLQPVHDASVMKVVTTGKPADFDSTSIFIEADGTLTAMNPRGARWRVVSVASGSEARNLAKELWIFLCYELHCGGSETIGSNGYEIRLGRNIIVKCRIPFPAFVLPYRQIFQVVCRYNRRQPQVW